MMINRKNHVLIFAFTSLLFLGACEQDASLNSPNSSRLTFSQYENEKQIGEYSIHVNALTTAQLPTEIAKGYKILRSKNRAMMNVAIRKKTENGHIPVPALVNVVAKNLSNQLKNIDLREIEETDPLAIYYIGELPVSNEETIVFDLDVVPEGENDPILLSYRQQFFTE